MQRVLLIAISTTAVAFQIKFARFANNYCLGHKGPSLGVVAFEHLDCEVFFNLLARVFLTTLAFVRCDVGALAALPWRIHYIMYIQNYMCAIISRKFV